MNEKKKHVLLPEVAGPSWANGLALTGRATARRWSAKSAVRAELAETTFSHGGFGAHERNADFQGRFGQRKGSRRSGTCPQRGAATCLRQAHRYLQEERPLLGVNRRKKRNEGTRTAGNTRGARVYSFGRKAFGKEPCAKAKRGGRVSVYHNSNPLRPDCQRR